MSKRNENLVVKTTALALCNNPCLKNVGEQDVRTKEKKSLSNLKQRKSATWCKTTGILWNPLPLPFAQAPSPIKCFPFPDEFHSFKLVQVWSNSIKNSGFTPVCTSFFDTQVQFEGCKKYKIIT